MATLRLACAALAAWPLASALKVYAPLTTAASEAAAPQTFVIMRADQASEADAQKTCATTRARRPKKPESLAEYREEAEGCLSWCGQFSENCYEGCRNDCVGYLGPPQCTQFVAQAGNACDKACEELKPGYECIAKVTKNTTDQCYKKILDVKVPGEDGCKYR
eukprot:TRINITY_DN91933_c0_g1_i1.p2 TRINITY_DN91933_c0_g1~~TRINITY_DN91933_c0_g1_i1.p2  ORF type:complete len:163 (+),score=47.16 TRINITY_DN91933_c0_g1_i1:63-551(+)